MITLEEANKIMCVVNKTIDTINNKKEEFDAKRWEDKEYDLVYQGLRFAHIELCDMISELEPILLNEEKKNE
jgi:hypothetical protein